jgi:hypothetical protein
VNALIKAPGFYPDITPEQYFAEPCPAPALTNSGIGTLLRYCPARFAYDHPAIGQPEERRKDTAATYMGSLVHRLALGKGADYAVSPHDEYRTKEAKAWRDDTVAAGLVPVKAKDFDAASQMAERISGMISAELGTAEYQTEVVVVWRFRDRWFRAMIDVWCPSLNRALDVKTIVSADDLSIDRAFAGGYGRQEAWYLDGIEVIAEGPRPRFDFLFVEKDAPYLGRVASSTEAMRHGSRLEIDRAFHIFDACISVGKWPGYSPRQVQPTAWQVREWAEAELEEAA